MKKYIILREYNGHLSAFNTALFDSQKEAEKYLKFYQAKYLAEVEVCDKFWGHKPEVDFTAMPLRVAEIKI